MDECDRYDDREIVRTNLIENFELLMDFIKKNLLDKFSWKMKTESDCGKKDQMYTENANRAVKNGFITPENLEPNPKNPLIASFFRNIGRADRLGSGVHKLFKYTKFYPGKAPVFEEGDVFRIVVPLDDDYLFDMGIGSETNRETNREDFFKINMAKTLAIITEEPSITQSELKDKLQISLMSVKRLMKALQDNGMIERIGSNRKGYWKITKENGHSNT